MFAPLAALEWLPMLAVVATESYRGSIVVAPGGHEGSRPRRCGGEGDRRSGDAAIKSQEDVRQGVSP